MKDKNISIKHKSLIKAADAASSKHAITLNIIKEFQAPYSAEPESTPQETTPLSLVEHQHKTAHINSAAVLKKNADEEARIYKENELAKINEELQGLRESTYQDAYNEGRQAGEGQLLENANALLEAINQFGQSKNEDLLEKRSFIFKIASTIAEHIIQKEIQSDNTIFNSLFTTAFEKITDKDLVIIESHPSDIEKVNSYKNAFEEKFKSIKQLEIKENLEITPGGFTIETNLGFIDARVESKLELIEKALADFHRKEDEAATVNNENANNEIDTTFAPSSANEESPQENFSENTKSTDVDDVNNEDNALNLDEKYINDNNNDDDDDDWDLDDFNFED